MTAHRLYTRVSARVLLLAACCVLAIAPGRPAQAQDAKQDAAILPYLDHGTFLVARLDVDRVDAEALGKYMEQSFDTMVKSFGIPADQQGRVKQDMMESIGTTKTWLADMTAAGAKQLYILLDTADIMAPDSTGPTIVVPLGDGSDEQRITDILNRNNGSRMQAATVGKAVVSGSPSSVQRLTKRLEPGTPPVTLPDLAAAMSAAGDAPLRVALVPGDAARDLVEKNLPRLPEPLGGGETTIISRGIRYATIAVTQEPTTQAKLMLRAKDAQSAGALVDVITKGKAFAKSNAEGMADADELRKHLEAIAPKREGDVVSVSVDPMLMMSGVRMSARREIAPPPGAPAGQPAKPDDGGL